MKAFDNETQRVPVPTERGRRAPRLPPYVTKKQGSDPSETSHGWAAASLGTRNPWDVCAALWRTKSGNVPCARWIARCGVSFSGVDLTFCQMAHTAPSIPSAVRTVREWKGAFSFLPFRTFRFFIPPFHEQSRGIGKKTQTSLFFAPTFHYLCCGY